MSWRSIAESLSDAVFLDVGPEFDSGMSLNFTVADPSAH